MNKRYIYPLVRDDEVSHSGVKGMKWGIRRYQNEDGTLTEAGKAHYAQNYRPDQIKRDLEVYGRGGTERINKRMKDEGMNISGARSVEAERAHNAAGRAKIAKKIGKVAGAVGGAVGGYVIATKLMQHGTGNVTIDSLMRNNSIQVTAAISGGMAKVGSALAGSGAGAVTMLTQGYNPKKTWRYE